MAGSKPDEQSLSGEVAGASNGAGRSGSDASPPAEARVPQAVDGELGPPSELASPPLAAPPLEPPRGPAAITPFENEPEPPPLFDQQPSAVAARILALSALLGVALSVWLQFSVRSRGLTDLLLRNELGKPERRQVLLLIGVGLVAGAAVGGAVSYLHQRRGQVAASFERWLWFLSPLLLLPAVPQLFRAKAWQDRQSALLSVVLLLSLAFEALVGLSLRSIPNAARDFWRQTAEQVPAWLRKHGPLGLVLLGAFAYASFFTFFLLRWHYKLRTGNFDLSINNNLMFGGLHGDFLKSTVAFPNDPGKYLAAHAKFGHYLFLPIYALFPRPETLLVIQSSLIGAGAIPLFLFARRHLSEWAAAVFALVYLAYYPMHGASFSEFQNVPIAALFVYLVVWSADAQRWGWFVASTAIALMMREDVPVGLAIIGTFLLVTGYRPSAGLALAVVSTSYFLILRFYVMDEAGDWWFPTMYKDLWADDERGFRSVLKTLVSNPLFVITKVVVEKKLVYLVHLLLPIAFLPLRRWYLWLALIPGVLLTLLVTNYDPPTMYSFHYTMLWAPFLFMASVIALAAIRRSPDFGVRRAQAALITVCAVSLVLSFNYGAFAQRAGSFKGGFNKIEFTYTEAEAARYQRLRELVKDIPAEDSVAATEKVGPHVSSRRVMHTMRSGPHGATWIVASSRELKLSKTKPSLRAVLERKEYGVVARSGDFALFKKGYDTRENARLISEWGL